jgi:hypothetical protein
LFQEAAARLRNMEIMQPVPPTPPPTPPKPPETLKDVVEGLKETFQPNPDATPLGEVGE